jgi:hypothetical protein
LQPKFTGAKDQDVDILKDPLFYPLLKIKQPGFAEEQNIGIIPEEYIT